MGQEYRVRDTKLDGDVALKGLPQALRDRPFGVTPSSPTCRWTTAEREAPLEPRRPGSQDPVAEQRAESPGIDAWFGSRLAAQGHRRRLTSAMNLQNRAVPGTSFERKKRPLC